MVSEDSKIGGSMEEIKERHLRYLRAMNNQVRREILRVIKASPSTMEGIQSQIKLDTKILSWHLDILEWGFCIKKETRSDVIYYHITQEGRVVDYVDK